MNKYNICFTSDENYAQHLAVAIVSILKNSDINDEFCFWVVDDNISIESKGKIERLKSIKDFKIEYLIVNSNEFIDFPRRKDGLPVNSYFLIKVPDMLDKIDKMLFLDCDIVVRRRISDIFNFEIGDNYILAVEDINGEQFRKERNMREGCFYFNSGVFVLNCKKWRKDNIENKCFEYVKKNGHTFKFQDQEILNGVLCEKAKKIDLRWNFQYVNNYKGGFSNEEFDKAKNDSVVIHYITGEKPWKANELDEVTIEYWRYLIMTPFFIDNREKFEQKIDLILEYLKKRGEMLYKLENIEKKFILTKKELLDNIENINNIYSSKEWRIALGIQKIFKTIFPVNSLRRNFAMKLFNFLKKCIKICFKIKRIIFSFLFLIKNYLLKFKPRKKRIINFKSKKIIYVDHSYHKKTKSNEFILNYLKEFFDVEVVWDESWKNDGTLPPDLSFVDKNYLGVLFFQSLPQKEILKNIKNENIIFLPMYDGVSHDYDFWKDLYNLKIINLSKTLHSKLKKWGLETMYIQYFCKPHDFIPGAKNEVFFWQRLDRVNICTMEKIFDKQKIKMHIHKAVDPYQKFMQPTREQEEKYKITYSDWFETREQMLELADKKGIYIAPREYEGIGMSFLEAMAMGKAVVAVNNPTMNEYIEHGKTGYLYDLKNPKPIDLSNIEEVQKNAYQYMQEGYQKWERNKWKIIEFIKKQ